VHRPPARLPQLTSPRFFALGPQACSADFFEFFASRCASIIDFGDRALSVRMIRPEPLARIGAEAKEGAPQEGRAVAPWANPGTIMPAY
jgi:hypothetical protein